MRAGQSEINRRIGAGFQGLRALAVALAVLLTAFAAALWPATPAYAQSQGCNDINSGLLNWTHPNGIIQPTRNFVAGEEITSIFNGDSGAAAEFHVALTIPPLPAPWIAQDIYTFTESGPQVQAVQVLVPLSGFLSILSTPVGGLTGSGTITVTCTPATPVLTSLSATSGYTAGGGDPVQITGSGFYPTTEVLIGSTPVASTYVSDTRIDVTMTPHARGPVQIGLRSGSVTSGTQTYTYLAPGALSVTDGDGFHASGPVGGLFTPSSKTWTLENTGDEDIEILVSTSGPGFFDVSNVAVGTPFTLAPQSSQDVTVSFGAAANALPAGMPSGGIQFTNETNGSGNATRTVELEVLVHTTSLDLVSSHNPSLAGDPVIFTATLLGGYNPTGSVEFFADGVPLGAEPLVGGAAMLDTSNLAVGSHQITAVYSGDVNNGGAVSNTVTQSVDTLATTVSLVSSANPSVIRDTVTFTATVGPASATGDVVFSVDGVDQATAALSGGTASWSTGLLDTGTYEIVARYPGDATHAGSVSDALVQEIFDYSDRTLEEIAAFLEARANILLANMPSAQRRFARLKGQAPSISSPGSILMSYLPILVSGGTLSGSASLAQIEALAGNEQQSRLDAWMEGTFGLLSTNASRGQFGIVSMGADYLLSEDVLIGGYFQIDHLAQHSVAGVATTGGTGWLAGPYLTARLAEHLYFDFTVAGGRAENRVNPSGTYEDFYGSTRFLVQATLQGEWSVGDWTFEPAASGSWFSETTDAYVDGLGVTIPATSIEQAQFTAGPGVRHVMTMSNGARLATHMRADIVSSYKHSMLTPWSSSVHGRVSGGVDIGLTRGGALAFSLNHDGLFSGESRSTSVNVRFTAPLR